jgi:hypothetical protein
MEKLFHRKCLNIALLLLWIVPHIQAQFDDPCKFRGHEKTENALPSKPDSLKPSKWKLVQKHQFDVAFNGRTRNEISRSICKLSASSRLSFELKYLYKKTTVDASLIDETSATFLLDSIFEKQNDLLRLKISTEHNTQNENFKKSVSAQLSTQKLPAKKNGSDINESAFLSPAELILALGMNVKLKSQGRIECGIGSLRFTWIDQKKLYDLQKSTQLHGIEKGRGHKLEGGFSLQAQWQKTITKNITWENKTLLFSSITELGMPNLELRNDLLVKSGKSVQTAVRSIYTYNKTKWPPASFGGEIALGVMLNKN